MRVVVEIAIRRQAEVRLHEREAPARRPFTTIVVTMGDRLSDPDGLWPADFDLLARLPDPSEAELAGALGGNLCRCTGYVNIVRSVRRASELVAEAEAEHGAAAGDRAGGEEGPR